MQIINDPKLDFKDVLILPKVSNLGSRKDVDLTRTFQYRTRNNDLAFLTCIPIIASNMDGVGEFAVAKELAADGCLTAIVKHKKIEEWREVVKDFQVYDPDTFNSVFISIGMSYEDLVKATSLITEFHFLAPKVCIDVANGYNIKFEAFVSYARKTLPENTFIIAGNVVTASQTERLLLAGANAVKVGIGSGSVCTTRKVTGVGMPQLSAIIECADAAHGMGGLIVADGGCQTPGDICKAFGAGADFVMLGGMLAGHKEGVQGHEHDGLHIPSKQQVRFYGSSSKHAQNSNMAEYRSSEGKVVLLKERGSIIETLHHILGGLRSCCTYVGAKSLKELSKRTTFVRVYNGQQYNTMFGDDKEIT